VPLPGTKHRAILKLSDGTCPGGSLFSGEYCLSPE
jgi:hypothetical protein